LGSLRQESLHREIAMKLCKYCQTKQPDEAFEVCAVVKGKTYRRLKCQRCKRATTNLRRGRLRAWLDEYKKDLSCERCGFADFRALEFHHPERDHKTFNVADMIRSCLSVRAILMEIHKCQVLCANCHRIEHYDENK
jgi:hypothetical protein